MHYNKTYCYNIGESMTFTTATDLNFFNPSKKLTNESNAYKIAYNALRVLMRGS